MDSDSVVPIIIAIVGSGGFLGGVYALLKLRPEAGQITVTAAQGAVIVQTGVIDSLREELERQQQRIKELELCIPTLDELGEQNKSLRIRVTQLEAELGKINGEGGT